MADEDLIARLFNSEGQRKLGEVASMKLQELRRAPPSEPFGDDDEDEIIETDESDDAVVKSAASAPTAHVNLFQHPDTHPAVLDILLLQKYGPEWMLWESETLQARIPQDFHTQGVSDLNLSKIQAMKTLHLVDTPWLRWEVFVWCAMPANSLFPDFEVMQVPTVAQCLVAIDTFNTVRQDVVWSDEVKAYLGVVWKHEGMFFPIDPADFVVIDRTNTDIDYSKVVGAWPSVRASGQAPTDDSANSEQLRRMLDAHLYLKENRESFERQMRSLLGT